MKRVIAILASVALLGAIATGVLVWQLSRTPTSELPEISAYTRGQLVRVGPYFYCQPRTNGACESPGTIGHLVVNDRDAVQLSLPPAIARSWWELRQDYGEQTPPKITEYLPGSDRLAVTIATTDPERGRLAGIAVQLKTLAVDESGTELEWRHAEWSVSTEWP
ncbi:MAG: DUF2771 domain-containing protein [Mycobacterium sp.]